MIRVNLLPEASRKVVKKRIRRTPQIPVTWIIIGLVAILVTTLLLGVVHWTFGKRVDGLRSEITIADNEIHKLGLEIKKVQQFKGQKEDLEKKLNVIHQLKVAQKGPVHLLDQLASAIPPRLWLQEISENGKGITIQGAALTHAQISTFMENLEKSPFFSQVQLSSAVIGTTPGGQRASSGRAKSFQLTSRIHFPKDL